MIVLVLPGGNDLLGLRLGSPIRVLLWLLLALVLVGQVRARSRMRS